MADKKPSMTRHEIEESLSRGERVAIAGRQFSSKRDLPPVQNDEYGKPIEEVQGAVVARTADGRLTHAGMVNAIEHGGSVMHKGEVISKVDELPDEAELVRHDEEQKAALATSYDEQIAALQLQKAKLSQASEAEKPASHPAHAGAHAGAHKAETKHKG